MAEELLKLDNVTQVFGGLCAVSEVSFSVNSQDIFGIIGPNGAGKSTLFNIITGIYTPTEGTVFFKGQPIHHLPPYKLASLGIGRTFQNIRLFSTMSVLENVLIGGHGITTAGFLNCLLSLPKAKKEEKQLQETAKELLEMVGLYQKRMDYAKNLSYGEQRRLEIVRALALHPSLLLLDEPAAGMNPNEKEELMQLITRLKNEMKITVLLVEHDMNLVMNICERLVVLNYGSKIAEGTAEEIKKNQDVIDSYLGSSHELGNGAEV